MSLDAAQRVRSQLFPALIGAALMLYFGFVQMAEPTGTDLFNRAAWVFYQTLRLGGVAMALVAASLLTGHPLALIADAVVTVICGLLFVGTGGGMLLGGGEMIQIVINLFCGTSFVSSGMRSWKGYYNIAVPVASPLVGGVSESAPRTSRDATPDETRPSGYLAALADQKRRQHDGHQP